MEYIPLSMILLDQNHKNQYFCILYIDYWCNDSCRFESFFFEHFLHITYCVRLYSIVVITVFSIFTLVIN